jgi:hypothetical protein
MRFRSRSVLFGSACALVVSAAAAGIGVTVAHAVAPVVGSLSITTDTSEGGSPITITGSNFTGTTAIGFYNPTTHLTVSVTATCPIVGSGSDGCINFSAVTATTITAVTPGHPKNALIEVTVTAAGVTSDPVANSPGDNIAYTAGVPDAASLSVHSGTPASRITISPATRSQELSAFDFTTQVTFTPAAGQSGTAFSVTSTPCPTSGPAPAAGCYTLNADLDQLTAPTAGFTTGIVYDVTVTTAGGTGAVSPSTDQFTFAIPHFAPHNVGAPQVAVTPDGSQQIVFWRDTTTNQLAEAWYTGYWNGPVGFPQLGTLTSTPAVAVTKDGSQQLVFWQGPGGHLLEAWYALASWHGPLDITSTYLGGHGILGSAPSVVTTTDGSQLVFWRGTDGHLGEAWYAVGGWHGPSDIVSLGKLASAPSATITPDGSQQLVFFQGADNHLTEDWYALGSWHGPVEFGALSSPPSVTVTPDGSTQLVFSKTAAGHLQESWYTLGSWHGPIDWTSAAFAGNGLLTSSPSATVTVDGSTQIVFWQGAGATLWEGWYTAGGWHGPVNFSG